jgi:hypothetical protein
VIEDVNAAADRALRLVAGGLKSKKRAIMELARCSEADAQKQLMEIEAESQGAPYPTEPEAASAESPCEDAPFLGD